MRRLLALVLCIGLVVLSGCNSNPPTNISDVQRTEQTTNTNDEPNQSYIGEYAENPLYKLLFSFESCIDPDELSSKLTSLYGEEIHYIMLEVTDDNNSSYKSPYDDFVCQVCTMYNSYRIKSPITTNTYLFFLPYSEEPIFVMDSEGSYLCGKYEIKNFDDGTHCHVVNSWLLSDLFCTRYGYIDDDAESKNDLKIAVDNIEKYVSFENLISKMQ